MAARERPPTLRLGGIVLRAPEEWDAAALVALLTEPEVARWSGANDLASVRALIERDEGWVVLVSGTIVGWAQYSEETEPEYRHVGLDILLTTPLHGRGYGRRVLRMVIDYFALEGHHRFTIDPRADNERAIRSYTAVGFRPVGVMRSYERDAEGVWHDGLLMDLLVEELEVVAETAGGGPTG